MNNMPAFPKEGIYDPSYGYDGWKSDPQEGMSLRDYFAAKAMQGILSNSQVEKNLTGTKSTPEEYSQAVSILSYKYADAMMGVREK